MKVRLGAEILTVHGLSKMDDLKREEREEFNKDDSATDLFLVIPPKDLDHLIILSDGTLPSLKQKRGKSRAPLKVDFAMSGFSLKIVRTGKVLTLSAFDKPNYFIHCTYDNIDRF